MDHPGVSNNGTVNHSDNSDITMGHPVDYNKGTMDHPGDSNKGIRTILWILTMVQ